MEVMVIILLVLNVGLVGLLLFRSQKKGSDTAALLIKEDLTGLSKTVGELREGLRDQLDEKLSQTNKQMVAQYDASSKIIREVTEKLTSLEKTNQQVGDIASELKVLQNVLSNPKQRGVLGEYYLQTVLQNVLAPEQFALQHHFADGEIVDAVIYLQDGKILPIDSKFSLENYNRLIDEKDKTSKERLVKVFKEDLKRRIDETSKYIRPDEDTMDFAFMFIPSEAIYYDLLINKVGASGTSSRDLIEYAFLDKKVIIVSPTSFMAYLQTVLQGLRSLQIEEQAKDIQKRVGQLGTHIAAYDLYMQKLGNSLGVTVGHYNTAHKELKKIDKDVVKIAQTNPAVEPMLLDRPLTDQDD